MLKPSSLVAFLAFLACLALATSAFAGTPDVQIHFGDGGTHKLTIDVDDDVSKETLGAIRSTFRMNVLMKCAKDAKPGKARLDVHIEPDGTVAKVEPKHDSIEHGLTSCVSKMLERAEFEEADGERAVIVRLEVAENPKDDGTSEASGSTKRPRSQGFGRIGGVARKPTETSTTVVLVSVDGPLDQKALEQTLQRKRRIFDYCYKSELSKQSDLEGDITATMEITKEGRNETAKIESSTVDNSNVEKCVVKTLTRSSLGKADTASTIEVRLEFRQGTGD